MGKSTSRRDFIRKAAATGVGFSVAPFSARSGKGENAGADRVRLGFIGVGARGTSHLRGLLAREDVAVPAISDVKKENLERALALVEESGRGRPQDYGRGETDYRRMLEQETLDGVVISTPWLWHVPMATAAMEAGAYAGVEVPAATTVEGCWDLVHTSEETGVPCMMLENVCYRRDVMTVLKMVRAGLFGTLVHARCGYRHNLWPFLFNDELEFGPGTGSVSSWRTEHHVRRNGDLYPTHGIGPVAHWLDINRGNRFLKLTSTASKAVGLHHYIEKEGGEDHPNEDVNFQKGDVVTTTIETAGGETIIVTHDVTLPRPYSLGFEVQGTEGLWDLANGVHVRGRSPSHAWEPLEAYQEFDPALWQRYARRAEGSGHGGMDFFVRNAFVESIKRGVQPPMDVYDAAAWSVISPLSEASIAQGSAPVAFPDFTDGQWMSREPIFATDGAY